MDNEGKELSVEEVLSRYSDMVYRLAYARTKNRQDAEDITQEVFLKYMRSEKSFADEEHRKAWLLRVTANTSKSILTSAWAKHYARMEELPEESCQIEEKSEVFYAVQKLPEKYRIVIQLYYYEELSVQEISEILSKKESTVKSLLLRGRERVKNLLEEGEQYEF